METIRDLNMLGIIGGTGLFHAEIPPLDKTTIATPYGPAEVWLGDIAIVMRHQFSTPPHRINHPALLSAMAIAGVDRIIAFGSVGSLKKEYPVGSIVLPDDYYSPSQIPTVHNNAIGHVAPAIDRELIAKIHDAVPEIIVGGTYVQTRGPRFETVAEIKNLVNAGDIVGMTVAGEAAIANELGIPFAAVCMVDNYCNGLCKDEISYESILKTSKDNVEKTNRMIRTVIDILG